MRELLPNYLNALRYMPEDLFNKELQGYTLGFLLWVTPLGLTHPTIAFFLIQYRFNRIANFLVEFFHKA
jgi:hypothetical protein